MRELLNGGDGRSVTKADAVAYAVNTLISELVIRATRDDGVRNYYDIAVVGYSEPMETADDGCTAEGIRYLLDDGRRFVPVTELAVREPRRASYTVERTTCDGTTLLREEGVDMWIEPWAAGGTPMYEALFEIRELLRGWCAEPANAESFPPVVINITDGEASDCNAAELTDICRGIKGLRTGDGNVLLMNIHITADTARKLLLFPTRSELEAFGVDRYTSMLADCSSVMPSVFNGLIADSRAEAGVSGEPYLAMGYNISPEGLFCMLNIGSRSVTGLQ